MNLGWHYAVHAFALGCYEWQDMRAELSPNVFIPVFGLSETSYGSAWSIRQLGLFVQVFGQVVSRDVQSSPGFAHMALFIEDLPYGLGIPICVGEDAVHE